MIPGAAAPGQPARSSLSRYECASGSFFAILSTTLPSWLAYLLGLSNTSATPCPRQISWRVKGSRRSTITVPFSYGVTVVYSRGQPRQVVAVVVGPDIECLTCRGVDRYVEVGAVAVRGAIPRDSSACRTSCRNCWLVIELASIGSFDDRLTPSPRAGTGRIRKVERPVVAKPARTASEPGRPAAASRGREGERSDDISGGHCCLLIEGAVNTCTRRTRSTFTAVPMTLFILVRRSSLRALSVTSSLVNADVDLTRLGTLVDSGGTRQ